MKITTHHHQIHRLKHLNLLFIPLALALILGSFYLKNQTMIQMEFLGLAVFFYLASAYIHHYFDKSLTIEVIVEYILIATLVLVLAFSALSS